MLKCRYFEKEHQKFSSSGHFQRAPNVLMRQFLQQHAAWNNKNSEIICDVTMKAQYLLLDISKQFLCIVFLKPTKHNYSNKVQVQKWGQAN
jgi:hypothetical protein